MNLNDYKIYIHRERGFVNIPFFKGKKYSEVLNLNIDGFRFISRKQGEQKFGRMVNIYTVGRKYIAGISLNTGKVHFDTTMGLQNMLDKLIESLKRAGYEVNVSKIEYRYLEVCARIPWKKLDGAYLLLEKVEKLFRTRNTRIEKKRHDSISGDWMVLVQNILFGKFIIDIKVYLAVKCARKKFNEDYIRGVDYDRLPKIEVQIDRASDLNTALNEVISIMIAFLKAIDCFGEEMTEQDYKLVRLTGKNQKAYQQIYSHLKKPVSDIRIFHTDIPKSNVRAENIASMLYEKPLCVYEIAQTLGVSENTIRNDLNILKNQGIIYARGRSGIPIMYAIKLRGLADQHRSASPTSELIR